MTCPPLRIRVQSTVAGSPERILDLAGPSVVLGRGRAAQVRLPGDDVSAAHARLQWTNGELRLEDLGSVNGTRIGQRSVGQRSEERSLVPGRTYPLAWGEPFRIADYLLTVLDPATAVAAPLSGEAGTATLAAYLVRDMAGGRDTARLRVRDPAGNEWIVPLAPGDRLRLGRGPGCQVRLEDPDLSRDHAEIRMAPEGATLRDLASKNGVTVNGVDWPWIGSNPGPLRHGDVIRLGGSEARYEDPAEALLAELNEPQPRPRDEEPPDEEPPDDAPDKDEPDKDEPDKDEPDEDEPDPGTDSGTGPGTDTGRFGRALLIVLGLTLMGAAVYLLLWLFA